MSGKQALVIDLESEEPAQYTGPFEGTEKVGGGKVKYLVKEPGRSVWDWVLPWKTVGVNKTHFSLDPDEDVHIRHRQNGRPVHFLASGDDAQSVIKWIMDNIGGKVETREEEVKELRKEVQQWKRKYKRLEEKLDEKTKDNGKSSQPKTVTCDECMEEQSVAQVNQSGGYCPECKADLAHKEAVNVNAA